MRVSALDCNCSGNEAFSRRQACYLQWQQEVSAGKDAIEKGLLFSAYHHFKSSLESAKQLFNYPMDDKICFDNVITAVITSYMNICDVWEKQNQISTKQLYLIDACKYLVQLMVVPTAGKQSKRAITAGLKKLILELEQIKSTLIESNHNKIVV